MTTVERFVTWDHNKGPCPPRPTREAIDEYNSIMENRRQRATKVANKKNKKHTTRKGTQPPAEPTTHTWQTPDELITMAQLDLHNNLCEHRKQDNSKPPPRKDK